ncbi:unnamed protein product [Cylindrotheca closterium]|uniref:Uncharacterized protein n=1 Tax=Cylindrotheca closterium TaxID=2856 RepID=A0AAD2CC37_9STRA|nr:unnamed protein product [Cylindrotheca closterium]
MFRSRTPPSSSRSRSSRSTRSARGSTKSRRAGSRGGFADRIRRAAESGPTRKWVKVMRSPAPRIRFQVTKWIPINELTEEERIEYDREQAAIQEEKQKQQMQLQQEQQQQPQGDEHQDQKENEVKEVASTPESCKNGAPSFEARNVDSSVTNPQLSEEQTSAEKGEFPHSSTAPADEPPTKRTKFDEQVQVEEFPLF